MNQYTFTIPYDEINLFRRVIDRLEEGEYKIIKDITPINPDDSRSDSEAILEMDAESALTFRLGMKYVKIRRSRTEEELAEEKRINDQHTVKITVKVDGLQTPGGGTP